MKITKEIQHEAKFIAELTEDEYFEVTKTYTSKHIRVKEVTLVTTMLEGVKTPDRIVVLRGNRVTNRGEGLREGERISFWSDVKGRVPKKVLSALLDQEKEWRATL